MQAPPQLILMAGVYGAGKSHYLREIQRDIDLTRVVYVDPDRIRWMLPETVEYVRENPWTVGERTQRESLYLSELIQRVALSRRLTTVVDGSLQSAEWYRDTYLPWVRAHYPEYRVSIRYVTAPWTTVLERCMHRCEVTGRCIPLATLRRVYEQVPRSVNALRAHVDEVREYDNRCSMFAK